MNVFVLCTGRSGSVSFAHACEFIKNYTSGHESQAKTIGPNRLKYPENHIEADNRLSWLLGDLDKRYGDEAYYIHLIRDKEKTVKSIARRWYAENSINKAFASGILMNPFYKLSKAESLKVCEQYYDTVNANIELFLKDKTKTQIIHLESIKEDFKTFWSRVGAEGDLEAALNSFDTPHNISDNKWRKLFLYFLETVKTPILKWRFYLRNRS